MSDTRQNRWFFGVIGRFAGFEELAPQRRPTAPPMVGRRSRGAAFSQGVAQPAGEPQPAAFTLVELVAVIFTVAVLAALALPLLANPSLQTQQIQCLNNVKQLQIAWTCYAGDNNGKLALNWATDWGGSQTGLEATYQPGQPAASWVLGCVTNPVPALISHGLIYPYLGSIAPYKCPADSKMTPIGVPTLRTYSMNSYMGGYLSTESGVTATEFTKLATIGSFLPPATALTFIEENPATINDGSWFEDIGALAFEPNGFWIDSPGHYHLNSGCMAFADGHCQTRKWTDKYVLANSPINLSGAIGDPNARGNFNADPNSPDNAWVLPRCTVAQP
jgi:type II secretory pathway pseudopilin PulG